MKSPIGSIVLAAWILCLPVAAQADTAPKSKSAIHWEQRRYRKTGRATIIERPTIRRYPYSERQPVLKCAPYRACELELVPGDRLLGVAVGDELMWQFSKIEIRTAGGIQTHVLFKPTTTGLDTNALLYGSSGRTYAVVLQSVPTIRMFRYAFYDPSGWMTVYPAPVELPKKTEGKGPDDTSGPGDVSEGGHSLVVDPEKINYGYRIEGEATWKPKKVFDDGVNTYIVMPRNLASDFAPTFYVMLRSGRGGYVTVHWRGHVIIVPQLFKKGILQWGVGGERTRVMILKGTSGSFWKKIFRE